jgi:hypothetical protein
MRWENKAIEALMSTRIFSAGERSALRRIYQMEGLHINSALAE